MTPLTGDDADALIDFISPDLAHGAIALAALSRGEHADPSAIDGLAGALQAAAIDERITYPQITAADVDRVHRLRALLTSGLPSPDARALAAECFAILNGQPERGACF